MECNIVEYLNHLEDIFNSGFVLNGKDSNSKYVIDFISNNKNILPAHNFSKEEVLDYFLSTGFKDVIVKDDSIYVNNAVNLLLNPKNVKIYDIINGEFYFYYHFGYINISRSKNILSSYEYYLKDNEQINIFKDFHFLYSLYLSSINTGKIYSPSYLGGLIVLDRLGFYRWKFYDNNIDLDLFYDLSLFNRHNFFKNSGPNKSESLSDFIIDGIIKNKDNIANYSPDFYKSIYNIDTSAIDDLSKNELIEKWINGLSYDIILEHEPMKNKGLIRIL